ncbi:S8 family serine peptidase [Streptomyces sp. NPDC054796]
MSEEMTAVKNPAGRTATSRVMRRRLVPALAAVGAWTACLAGAAPAAVAEDVRSQQWYLDAMQAEKIWKVSTGEGVKVAVVDTGVDPTTSSLRGQVLPGKDLSGAPGGTADDDTGHGTTVAEIISGTGKGGGIRGLAPGAKIIPFRAALAGVKGVKEEDGDLSYKAIRAAADSDAKIINMSFGNPPDPRTQKAVEYAASKGKLLIAAAGNDRKKGNLKSFPAGYDEVAGVGATDEAGKVGDFSSSGYTVTLAAPGVDIPVWCDAKRADYCEGEEGTSFAAPIASASAALIWSKHPDWTANQVLRVMIDTAAKPKTGKIPSKYLGYGEVRPRMSVLENEGDPGDPGENPLTGEGGTSESSAPGGSSDSKKDNAADKVKVEDSASSDDSSQLWTILGVGAAVVVLGGGAFAFVRARRG